MSSYLYDYNVFDRWFDLWCNSRFDSLFVFLYEDTWVILNNTMLLCKHTVVNKRNQQYIKTFTFAFKSDFKPPWNVCIWFLWTVCRRILDQTSIRKALKSLGRQKKESALHSALQNMKFRFSIWWPGKLWNVVTGLYRATAASVVPTTWCKGDERQLIRP